MTIDVGIATPPHRSEAVAEFRIHHPEGGGVSIPAEMFREDGLLKIAIFGPEGGVAWEFRVADLLVAIGRGIELVER